MSIDILIDIYFRIHRKSQTVIRVSLIKKSARSGRKTI